MKKDRLTCDQRVIIILTFYPRSAQPSSINSLNKKKNKISIPDTKAIKEFGRFISERFEQVARMIEILYSVNDDWVVTEKKDKIILETSRLDFHLAVNALADEGFHAKDYQLYVEYERKWGIL
ncbi:hypothetical protein NIE88_05255 [Sporolactobacillus shoreicorticis]|uniref:Uncharacterized protein n=1 Tax=Sporolactobacillus shoreicorticis TaxID=1923877 RepID=A0ABW5RYZ0_9BACL|nr:hypothetical protein [Sporolactobacillus shoreicorticis]MCO7125179.1 hypothetical protein [Sporolactobacillus shoreicorticis]